MAKLASLLLVTALILPAMAQTPYESAAPPVKKKIVKKQIVLNPGDPPPAVRL